MSASPRILIIRLSSLGDILHTLPAFASLRLSFPDATIDWLAARKSEFLLAGVKGIDTLHILDSAQLTKFPPSRDGWRRISKLIRELRDRRYDYALDFQGLLKTAFLSSLTGSHTRIGFSEELVRERPAQWFYHRVVEKPREPVHVIALNQMITGMIGAAPACPAAAGDLLDGFSEDPEAGELLSRAPENYVVINPGGGWPTKRWDPNKFGLLAKMIRDKLGLPVAVTTGPGEETLFQIISAACGKPFPYHFPVPFLQLIPLFRRSRLFIGGDTGPFHLACAVGTPVVGIFGPTSAVRNGPWSPGEEVITHSLPCGPCYGRSCSNHNNECMDITVDEVFAGVVRRLKNKGDSSNARL